MKLSKKCEYALLALIELAREFDKGTIVSADTLAGRYDMPKKFLETILSKLKSEAIVEVYRGPRGGYKLAKDPSLIYVAKIIRLIDGPIAPLDSVSVHFYKSSPLEKEAKTITMFKNIRDYASDMLENTSLRDLT